MPETNEEEPLTRETILIIATVLIGILIGVVIAIPIVYSVGRNPDTESKVNVTEDMKQYLTNECTQSLSLPIPVQSFHYEALIYLNNSEPFPFRLFNYTYRPSVVSKTINLIFGFNHDTRSWSVDNITVIDLTDTKDIMIDGGFESNYLKQSYSNCILSNTRNSTSDILFDNPYAGDFYYNDQTIVGMNYLSQKLDVIGGRYYNITFYLENRGYKNNSFYLLVTY